MAIRSPGRRAAGLRSKAGHFRGNGLVLVAAEQRSQGPAVERGRRWGREEPFLHPAVTLQRVLDALEWERAILDRVDERLHRSELRLLGVAAHQDYVASGGDRQERRVGRAVRRADGLHADVVGEHHAFESESPLQQPGDDRG